MQEWVVASLETELGMTAAAFTLLKFGFDIWY
jgi:hypothetical protein